MLKMMKYLLHTLSCLLLFAAGTCLAQTPGHTLRSGGTPSSGAAEDADGSCE